MQFHQLMAFVKVAEHQSFSKAADSLFLSQSTVSTHINSLEKYFGQKLFDRLSKRVTLTPFGQRLYYWSKEILNIKEKAMGFSIISEIAARDYAKSKLINTYEILEMPATRNFYIAYNKTKTLSPINLEFIKFCKPGYQEAHKI